MRAQRHDSKHKSTLASYSSVKNPYELGTLNKKEAHCYNDLISGEMAKRNQQSHLQDRKSAGVTQSGGARCRLSWASWQG
jgi:hypothetical protein